MRFDVLIASIFRVEVIESKGFRRTLLATKKFTRHRKPQVDNLTKGNSPSRVAAKFSLAELECSEQHYSSVRAQEVP